MLKSDLVPFYIKWINICPGRALLHKPGAIKQILPEHSVLQNLDFAEAFQDELLTDEGKKCNIPDLLGHLSRHGYEQEQG